ncbi:putative ABC transporter permease subunit [Natranaerobius trueperi]|nr:hypothetical protein [Natranaerobius trueperi]
MTILNELKKLTKFEIENFKKIYFNKANGQGLGCSFYLGLFALFILSLIIFSFSNNLFRFLRFSVKDPEISQLLELNLLSLSVIIAFMIMVFNGIRVVFENYFESNDLQILLTLPLSIKSVFIIKFIKSALMNFLQVLPFVGALWLGYGVAARANILYFLVIILTLFASAIIFTSMASLFLFIIIRLVSSFKLKQIITIGSFTIAFLLFLVGQYFAQIAEFDLSPEGIVTISEQLLIYTDRELPHIWVARTLLLPVQDFIYPVQESVLPFMMLTISGFVLSIMFSEKVFLTGWSKSKDVQSRIKRPQKPKSAKSLFIQKYFSGIFIKDWLFVKRTPLMWYNMLIFIALLGFLSFNLYQGANLISNGRILNLADTLSVLLIIFFSVQAGGNIGGVSFSIEGDSLWILKTAPINKNKLYFSKLGLGMLSNSVIAVLATIIFNFVPDLNIYPLYFTIPLVLVIISALTSVNLYLDISKPNFAIGRSLNQIGGDNKMEGEMRSFSYMLIMFTFVLIFSVILIIGSVIDHWLTIVITLSLIAVLVIILNIWCYKKSVKHLDNYLIG